MSESCNEPSCHGTLRRARPRGFWWTGLAAFARGVAGTALLVAAACADGSDAASSENLPDSTPEAPAAPFAAGGAESTPPTAPGDSEGQEPEPNGTETNFITIICWEDSDCPGGTCELYAPDAGARAAAPPANASEDAGTPQSDPGVDRSGPPLGRCIIP